MNDSDARNAFEQKLLDAGAYDAVVNERLTFLAIAIFNRHNNQLDNIILAYNCAAQEFLDIANSGELKKFVCKDSYKMIWYLRKASAIDLAKKGVETLKRVLNENGVDTESWSFR